MIEQQVRQNLFIVLEPQLYDGKDSLWGVHPDQSRNRLIFTGNGAKGVKLPLSDWGLDFSDEMPQEIVDAHQEGARRGRRLNQGRRVSQAATRQVRQSMDREEVGQVEVRG